MTNELQKPLNKKAKPKKIKRSAVYVGFVSSLFLLAASPFILFIVWGLVHETPKAGRPSVTHDISAIQRLAHEKTAAIKPETYETEKTEHGIPDPAPAEALIRNELARPDLSLDPDLAETTRYGLVPRIGSDGRRPEDVYAQPPIYAEGQNPDTVPKVAIVLIDIGQDLKTLSQIMSELPKSVSLSFSPYGVNLVKSTEQARAEGYELYLQAPLEPFNYPLNDPGPQTLLAEGNTKDNLDRLMWVMSRIVSYVGFTNINGGQFLANTKAASFLAESLEQRGLIFANLAPQSDNQLKNFAQPYGLSYLEATRPIDRQLDTQSIDMALKALSIEAQQKGYAIGVSRPYPYVIKAIKKWSKGLANEGIALVPLSTMRDAAIITAHHSP